MLPPTTDSTAERKKLVRDINALCKEIESNPKRLQLCKKLAELQHICKLPGQPPWRQVVDTETTVKSYREACRYAAIGRSEDSEAAFAEFLAGGSRRVQKCRDKKKDAEVVLRNTTSQLKNAKLDDDRQLAVLADLAAAWGKSGIDLLAWETGIPAGVVRGWVETYNRSQAA
jgi:hypothetical protein